mmetsp:Transcript_7195/g.11967  ORF Transcript_7195/g.11967 Transcript_7195/m.11967 type:complete len:229 (+) Transcript_7195:222-908(+)|eukprot:CAMPEP_0174991076 /NCGR_PEP_ID=MMETSP0004_2-20121128/21678_1 /TAXON_ID=420556 /ORGANISM="Ochromonas sp., Strain CCMP1393" /LENGTH=228 /DNA_ID=CAMNT_0016244759 /DNA_START=120 /DNA_END=806 /DNA_ORIENTATION=-
MLRFLKPKSLILIARTSTGKCKSFHSSYIAQQKLVELVPALGESITEGEIASWCKDIGDPVAIDDVVVIVETDKVTVDIKSTNAGVLTRKIAGDVVEVGNELYEIDVDPSAVVAATAAANTTPTTSPPTTSSIQINTISENSNSNTSNEAHGRTPLIKFLGKRDKTKVNVLQQTSATSKVVAAAPARKPPLKEGTGLSFRTLKGKAFYGRPKLSQMEIDAIESGGASL